MKWKYLCGACLVVGGALWKAGAPPPAILLGISLAVLANLLRQRVHSHAPAGGTAKIRKIL